MQTIRWTRKNISSKTSRRKKNAIVNYERTILNLTDESVKTLLERIILDEELHVQVFKELLSNYFDIQV